MKNSKIEWTDHTFNPWIGCTKVSPGCQHCYAEALMDKRYGKVKWGPTGTRSRTSDAEWRKPLTWNHHQWMECPSCGWRGDAVPICPTCNRAHPNLARQRVFCASLADVFEDRPELEEWRDDLWELIHSTPNLDWLLLTKRPENIERLMWPKPTEKVPAPYLAGGDYLPNVWFGTSIENQQTADERIPRLLSIPARVRFLSIEPLLGPVDLGEYLPVEYYVSPDKLANWADDGSRWANGVDWVIVGGESGPNARPMHPDWVRSIQDQCQSTGVPFHFKQWGEWVAGDHPAHGTHWQYIDKEKMAMKRVGKKAAGRLLDGREWNEFPEGVTQ